MDVLHAQGIEEWAQLCSESFVPLQTAGASDFRGRITHLQLADLGISHVSCTRSQVYRSEQMIARNPRDDVLLSLQLTGSGLVEQAGRRASLAPGTGALYEADRPYRLQFGGPMSELVLQVPRKRLGLRDATLRDSSARPLTQSAPALSVLRHLLTGILGSDGPPDVVDRLSDTAVDLLAAALRSGASPSTPEGSCGHGADALVYTATVYMEQHLGDTRLDVQQLARRLGVSRRHLEAMFARHGDSPAARLRRMRLQRAEHLLATTTATVTQVAFGAGFGDVTTFGRAFKRHYGHTPREHVRPGHAASA